MLTDAQRKERIDILSQQADIYSQLYDGGRLSAPDTKKYVAVMKELDRLREIERCRYSIIEFAKRYFNDGRLLKPETPSPPFHYELSELLTEEINATDRNSFVAAVAPRSHAKSVLGTVISTLYIACYGIHNYVVIISNRQDGAKQLLAMVKYELANNELLRADFGDMYNRSNWAQMEIVTSTGVKIQAAGSGDALRGLNHLGSRPWILMDDIERDPDVNSPDYRDKIQEWVNSTVIPLGSPTPGGTKVIWLGTILHVDAVLNRVIKNDTRFKSRRFSAILEWPRNMHLWDEWGEILNRRDFPEAENEDQAAQIAGEKAREFYEANREAMTEGARVLWEQRMSLYDLMVIRQQNRKSFLTEYLGDPRDESTQLFTQFHYYDLSEINIDDLDIYGAVDPSLGKNAKSDLSAICTLGRHRRTGILYLLEMDAKRRSPDKIIEDILQKAQIYKYRGFAVETVAFQHFFKSELEKRSALAGVYLPIRELRPNSDKSLRVMSLEPLISSGFIRFLRSQRELIADFEEVGTDGSLPRFDDRLDVAEMAVSLVRQNKRTIAFSTL